jgi:hypothetical protein
VSDEYCIDGKVIHRNCEMGAGTTHYQLQDWANKNDFTLPFNVIMTEVTVGGTTSVPCHGSGINTMTLPDIVVAIKFVNVRGEVQEVTDKEQLRAAAGCLGLLGVVISITYRLDKMSYAQIDMKKLPLGAAIPPPEGLPLPEELRELVYEDSGYYASEAPERFSQFIDKCANCYYNEFFWFPNTAKIFTNCWTNTSDPEGVVRYPANIQLQYNRLEQTISGAVTNTILADLPNSIVANLVGSLSL